jgi:TolB-like protein/Tfp pilus assembly protein PilF
MTSFLSQLKQRRVYRVAIGYAIVAWLAVQIAATVLPAFHAPEFVLPVLIVLLGVGFPVALVLAWAFDVTPEGIEKTPDGTGATAAKNMRYAWALAGVGLLIAAVGVGAYWLWHYPGPKRALASEAASQNVVPEKTGAAATERVAPAASVAVLPFENLSDEKSNAYFAEGIQDEILTRLSKIASLKVISRTSTQKYKSAPDNLREVGKQLGVANLLEGSVQRVANSVHVNVQLIRAATDEHVWAESYNRKLDDVFGVEGEVAGAIAEQLNAKLTGAEQQAVAAKPTENLAAYDAYLRALSIEHRRYGYDAYVEASAEYGRAVQLDPNFALAWARLAVLRSFLYFNRIDANVNSAASVKEAADKASALQPDLAEAWVAQGAYRYRVQRDFAGALQAYDEARKRLPNSALVYQYMAYVERRLGRWADAEPHYKKAAELDPQNFQLFASEGSEFLAYLRRFDEAQAALYRALQISPGEQGALVGKANVFQLQGRLQEAAATLARIPAESTDDFLVSARVTQAVYERHFDVTISEVERKLKSIPAGQPLDSVTEAVLVQMGFCQEWMGKHDEAVRTFNRAVQSIKPTPDTVVAPEANGLPSILAFAYAGLGQKDKALAQAKQAVADYETDAVNKPGAEVILALIQAHFGDIDPAIAALPHLLEVPAGLTTANLRFDPFWDPLRKDPRFQKLCQEKQP